ncbi:MAG TPA: hypothetical protein VM285_07185, partial [Polyangia bacterium]|nr:hypothetical protein [Polyangia bacterium]
MARQVEQRLLAALVVLAACGPLVALAACGDDDDTGLDPGTDADADSDTDGDTDEDCTCAEQFPEAMGDCADGEDLT